MNARRHTALLALAATTAVLAGCTSSTPDNIPQNDKQANSNYDAQKKNDPIPTLGDSEAAREAVRRLAHR